MEKGTLSLKEAIFNRIFQSNILCIIFYDDDDERQQKKQCGNKTVIYREGLYVLIHTLALTITIAQPQPHMLTFPDVKI